MILFVNLPEAGATDVEEHSVPLPDRRPDSCRGGVRPTRTKAIGVSQPAVSKHMTVLKRTKLVPHRREGRETHYRAQPDALAPMVDWLRHYSASAHAD